MKKMVMAGLCVFVAFLSAAYGIMLFAAIGRQAFLLSCICLSGSAWWAWCARWFVNARLLEIEQREQMRRKVYWRQIKGAALEPGKQTKQEV